MALPFVISSHWLQALQGSGVGPCSQFRALAREPGGGCFPHPARPGKQEGVRHALAADRIPQGAGDMLLPNDVIERLRSPLPGKNEIAHSMAGGSELGYYAAVLNGNS